MRHFKIFLIGLAFFFVGVFPAHAFTFVQGAAGNNGGSGTTTTVAISSSGSGNLLFACASSANTSDTAVLVDNLGSTWTVASSVLETAIGWIIFPFYLANAPAGVTTVNFNFIKTATKETGIVEEFSGVATASPLDGTQKNATNTSFAVPAVWTTPSITTTNANDLLINCTGDVEGKTYASTTNWIVPVGGQTNTGVIGNDVISYRFVTSTATYSANGSSLPGGNDRFVNAVFAFKAAAGGVTGATNATFQTLASLGAGFLNIIGNFFSNADLFVR